MSQHPPTAAFELQGITKRFGEVVANDAVDLSVDAGEIHGLIGENGAGKTTLMGVLYGIHRPDAGEIRVAGRRRRFDSPLDAIHAGLGMVHQHFMLFDSLTVAENVVFGAEPERYGLVDRAVAAKRVAELAERYGLEVETGALVGGLPVGVQQRVEILKALYRQAAVLVLDEPTAVLTPGEQEGLFRVLRSLAAEGTAIVFISHKLPEVLTLCDRTTVLRQGRVTGTVVTAQSSAEELSRLMVGRTVSAPKIEPHEPGETVLKIESLVVSGRGPDPAVDRVDLAVKAREIVGIAGVAGNGQSELAAAIAGLERPRSGRIRLGSAELTSLSVRERRAAGLACVPEDRDGTGLATAASVAENALMGFEGRPELAPRGVLDSAAIDRRAGDLVDQLRIRTAGVRAAAADLSGGNRQKLVVGRELAHDARLLLVEQPTRGVDLAAIELIHRALLDYSSGGGAVLLISAELGELLTLADRILVMLGGRIVGELARESATEERLGLLMAGGG